jgi:hypothetical protein
MLLLVMAGSVLHPFHKPPQNPKVSKAGEFDYQYFRPVIGKAAASGLYI